MTRSRPLKIAVPDLISNSYFPVVAAVELGCFRDEGLDVTLDLVAPVERAYAELRDGQLDFVGGSAHSALAAFPNWDGVKLLCAQSQGMYWFLIMRADLAPERGALDIVKGKRIGAAPWVGMPFKYLLNQSGIDVGRDEVVIAPVRSSVGANVNFGVAAANALEAREIDGFWANGMGAEIAVKSGLGVMVLDVRRGDGPAGCFDYTFASLAATDRLIAEEPEIAESAIRALLRAQRILKEDPSSALPVARKFFSPQETSLIVDILRRDLPYYAPHISEATITGINRFAAHMGILDKPVDYADIVATKFIPLWTS